MENKLSYAMIILLLIFNIVSIALMFVFKSELKKCETSESWQCPIYTCPSSNTNDVIASCGKASASCGNRPYRCSDPNTIVCQPTR